MSYPKSNLILGLVLVAFALGLLWIWIPLDTDSGYIEKVRRQVTIGDAAAPSLAALFLLLGGALLILVERRADDQPALRRHNILFLGAFGGLLVLSLVVMRFAGPLAAALLAGDTEYRLLRDEVPWKYIGFVLGGTLLIGGGIAMIERRLTLRTVLLALVIAVAIMLVYDLPFDDLLLPPNGDV